MIILLSDGRLVLLFHSSSLARSIGVCSGVEMGAREGNTKFDVGRWVGRRILPDAFSFPVWRYQFNVE